MDLGDGHDGSSKRGGGDALIAREPWGPRQKLRLLKMGFWSWGIGACAWIAGSLSLGAAGANPAEWIHAKTGWQAMAWLAACLWLTPLSLIAKSGWLVGAKRLTGLWCLAFATFHMAGYAWLEQGGDVVDMASDFARRPFVALGWLAFAALSILGATSNGRSLRSLGRRWKTLHRMAYAIAILGLVHWFWIRAPKSRLAEWYPMAAFFLIWAVARVWVARGKSRVR